MTNKIIVPPRLHADLERIAEGRQHDPEVTPAAARELLKLTRVNRPLPTK